MSMKWILAVVGHTPLLVWHPRWRNTKRVHHWIVIYAPLWVSWKAILVKYPSFGKFDFFIFFPFLRPRSIDKAPVFRMFFHIFCLFLVDPCKLCLEFSKALLLISIILLL
jgi:hypothetical protein